MERSFWLDNDALVDVKHADPLDDARAHGEGDEHSVNGPEVLVTADYQSGGGYDSSGGPVGGFSLAPFFFGRDYGEGTSNPRPFDIVVPDLSNARDVVATVCEGLALAIKTLTDLSRIALPKSEERRLDALSEALERTADGLKLGDISLETARTTIKTSLTVALGELTEAGMGVFMGAVGAWATAYTPSPLLKILGTAGLGAIGIALEGQLDKAGVAEGIAGLMTDGLFAGAEALSDTIDAIVNKVYEGFNAWTGQYDPMPEYSQITLESTGEYANYDGYSSNGVELGVAIYHYGLGEAYMFTTNEVMPNWRKSDDGGDIMPYW